MMNRVSSYAPNICMTSNPRQKLKPQTLCLRVMAIEVVHLALASVTEKTSSEVESSASAKLTCTATRPGDT